MPPVPRSAGSGDRAWLDAVGAAAAAATRAPLELIGDYLPVLADAAIGGRRPEPWELAAVRELGRRAAASGVGARRAVDLYLSAAWRLWRALPVTERSADPEHVRRSAEAVLRSLDDAVGALVAGHQAERREQVRHEEALRREFVDDLLRGDADVALVVQRAEPFGLDLGKAHRVALAARRDDADPGRAPILLERAVVDRFGDRDVLVATKDGRVVVVVPDRAGGTGPAEPTLAAVLRQELARLEPGRGWRVAAGRPFPGAYGVARSYEEAREALTFAERLDPGSDVVDSGDLLVYRVLGRDQAAITDLVRDVLGPLAGVRGGPELLLDTLQAYVAAGDVATEAARRLHVSVRTVTYRLARVRALTGYDAGVPAERFALHAAVLGARLLDWPARPLPADH
ncbi:helix-turn-helix domain-containing protein [Blastococcus sp. TML/M2B]|uniref:PucR family transcriptional regulator n=1 Tax=unclassified Blastococcus TaxID=2619396 RepID=UPI00190AD1B1|nr:MULTISPECIES: helix-turn-helix domain-containing protein [unclassified Blastococcus]MBN1092874.1 helix-turn-helix domain-containing protein [Blastococcus sp. TML/M2B]MBN1097018.1 helix-turn-helix domain-containing protein [Blastococcus sp. TML/C7B]